MPVLTLYARAIRMLLPQRQLAILLAIASFAIAIVQLAEPVLFGRIIDRLEIDFPRPRPLSVMNTEAFGVHVQRIRLALNAIGGLE